MSGGDLGALTLLAAWSAWSLANVSARLKRIADALEELQRLAGRGRS